MSKKSRLHWQPGRRPRYGIMDRNGPRLMYLMQRSGGQLFPNGWPHKVSVVPVGWPFAELCRAETQGSVNDGD